MPLITNCGNVRDWETLHQDVIEEAKSTYLGHALMGVGISEITEKNWSDVYSRIEIVQKISGAIIRADDQPVFYTPKDILRRVGYWTNASDYPWTQFIKGIRFHLGTECIKAKREVDNG